MKARPGATLAPALLGTGTYTTRAAAAAACAAAGFAKGLCTKADLAGHSLALRGRVDKRLGRVLDGGKLVVGASWRVLLRAEVGTERELVGVW